MSLAEALARWARVKNPSPWTVVRYEQAIRSFAHFGIRELGDVRGYRVLQYVEFRLVFVTASTVNSEISALTSVLRFLAVDPEVLRAVKSCAVPAKKPRRLHARFLTRDEVDRLASAARARSRSAELPILVDAYLGLRVRELCRMRWSDIDLGEKPEVRVRIVDELGIEGRIKTGQERSVPVCRPLKELLLARQGARSGDFLFPPGIDAAGVGSPYPFMRPHSMRVALQRAVAAAGLRDVTWNTLRHTRASWWVQAGVPIAKVSRWLGHSPETCSRFYIGLASGYDPDCERAPAA